MTKIKFNSTKAVLEALLNGRHLSQLDCKEFLVEDMRTYISHLRPRYEDTHDLKSEWFVTPFRGSRLKSYWLEKKQSTNN